EIAVVLGGEFLGLAELARAQAAGQRQPYDDADIGRLGLRQQVRSGVLAENVEDDLQRAEARRFEAEQALRDGLDAGAIGADQALLFEVVEPGEDRAIGE